MSGLGGLNKTPDGVVIGLVQLQLPTIATKSDLAAQTKKICAMVQKARKNMSTALELAGLLTWCNRLVRVREVGPDLFGRAANRWRIIRTSNAYRFNDPRPAMAPCNRNPSKFDLQTETAGQVLLSLPPLQSGLAEALERLGAAVTGREGSTE